MENKLTPKKELFVQQYLISLNATEAAKLAGYSEKTAYSSGQRLLKDVEVKKLIEQQQQATSTKLGITKEELIQDLIDIKNNNKQDYPTVAIKAVEVLNKMNGFDAPEKIDHTTNGNDINPTTINIHIKKK